MSPLPQITEGRTKYVPYDLAPGRADAIWLRLRQQEQGRHQRGEQPTRRWVPAGGLALGFAACVCAALWFLNPLPRPEASPWSGTQLHAGNEPVRVGLQDGSEIEAFPHASLELLNSTDSEVRLALRNGSGHFSVAKNKHRSFIVQAGAAEVRVIGTRFTVERDHAVHKVRVQVEEGVVEVQSGVHTHRLQAGESLTVSSQAVPPPAEPAAAESADSSHSSTDEVLVISEEELALHDKAQRPSPQPARHRPRGNPRRRAATPRPDTPPTATAAPEARDLLNQAQQAQLKGERQRAADLLQTLLDKYPRDARVGLAAFELGRIRMDYLNDPQRAVSALRQSLRFGNSPFREDTLARLVQATETLHSDACQRYRQAYLDDYPNGRYARDVQRRCGGDGFSPAAAPSEPPGRVLPRTPTP